MQRNRQSEVIDQTGRNSKLQQFLLSFFFLPMASYYEVVPSVVFSGPTNTSNKNNVNTSLVNVLNAH